MDLILSNNFLVNSLMLPGLYGSTTYTYDQYKPDLDDLGTVEETANAGKALSAKQKYCRRKSKKLDVKGFPLRTIYIPFDTTNLAFADYFMNHPGDHIPAILQVAETNNAPFFVIHFHGNACDAAQVGFLARRESADFNAHYLIVEYPGYGLADGVSTESLLHSVAISTYIFVVDTLKVDPRRIIIIGRSVGTGIATRLSSKLQTLGMPPAAVVLHSAYTSIQDVAIDLIGCPSYLFLNRFNNWKYLCHTSYDQPSGVAPPAPTVYAPPKVVTEVSSSLADLVRDSAAKVERANTLSIGSTSNNSSLVDVPISSQEVAIGGGQMTTSTTKAPPIKTSKRPSLTMKPDLTLAQLYSRAICSVIAAPVLFIHADNDEIIDHHHSVTLHTKRQISGLISELFTQKSNSWSRKGHNRYEIRNDYLDPINDFLDSHCSHLKTKKDLFSSLKYGGGRGSNTDASNTISEHDDGDEDGEDEDDRGDYIELDLDLLTSCANIPPQFLYRASREAQAKMEEEKREAEEAKNNNDDGRSSSKSIKLKTAAVSPTKGEGPSRVIAMIWKGCSCCTCLRCCMCCPTCFCIECNTAMCNTGRRYFECLQTAEELEFSYRSKAERRGSALDEEAATKAVEEIAQQQQRQQEYQQQKKGRDTRGDGPNGNLESTVNSAVNDSHTINYDATSNLGGDASTGDAESDFMQGWNNFVGLIWRQESSKDESIVGSTINPMSNMSDQASGSDAGNNGSEDESRSSTLTDLNFRDVSSVDVSLNSAVSPGNAREDYVPG